VGKGRVRRGEWGGGEWGGESGEGRVGRVEGGGAACLAEHSSTRARMVAEASAAPSTRQNPTHPGPLPPLITLSQTLSSLLLALFP